MTAGADQASSAGSTMSTRRIAPARSPAARALASVDPRQTASPTTSASHAAAGQRARSARSLSSRINSSTSGTGACSAAVAARWRRGRGAVERG